MNIVRKYSGGGTFRRLRTVHESAVSVPRATKIRPRGAVSFSSGPSTKENVFSQRLRQLFSWRANTSSSSSSARNELQVTKPNASRRVFVRSDSKATFHHLHFGPSNRDVILYRTAVFLIVGGAGFYIYHLERVPITGRPRFIVIPAISDDSIGTAALNAYGANVVQNHPDQRLVELVGKKIARVANEITETSFDWDFKIVSDNSVNAACFPGGKVIVHTGLLEFLHQLFKDGKIYSVENALAVILSHEISHAVARHTCEQLSFLPVHLIIQLLGETSPLLPGIWDLTINKPYSRAHEREADHIGMILMARACYNPYMCVRLWSLFKSTEWYEEVFSSHPSDARREDAARLLLEEAERERESRCGETKTGFFQSLKPFGIGGSSAQ